MLAQPMIRRLGHRLIFFVMRLEESQAEAVRLVLLEDQQAEFLALRNLLEWSEVPVARTEAEPAVADLSQEIIALQEVPEVLAVAVDSVLVTLK